MTAFYSSNNLNVATTSGSTATGIGVGQANGEAFWNARSTYIEGGACAFLLLPVIIPFLVDVEEPQLPPTVTITAIKAVGKKYTAVIRVTTTNPNNVPITLTPVPKPQTTGAAQFTSNNSSTRQITATLMSRSRESRRAARRMPCGWRQNILMRIIRL